MSSAWSLSWKDVRSALRHTVIPLMSGVLTAAGGAAIEVVQTGTFSVAAIQAVAAPAAIVAAISGLIRLAQRYVIQVDP